MLSISPGQKFGRLIALYPEPRPGFTHHYWRWACECGREKVIYKYSVLRGDTRSCGCFRSEELHRLKTKHGHRRIRPNIGPRNSREYNAWVNAKTRCYNPKCVKFPDYGGRGIVMCDRWRTNFKAFLHDMGPAPPGKSLGRLNNDGPYEPQNCAWQTAEEQQANTRVTKRYEVAGLVLTVAEAARKFSVNYEALGRRIRRGESMESAIHRLLRVK